MSKKKKAEKRLPETIYVKYEMDGDDGYFLAGETDSELAESEPAIVGQYALVNISRLKLVATEV